MMLQRRWISSLGRTQGRLVIIGSGWGGFHFMRAIDQKHYDVVMVSPRNFFVFTPLLASTCVGTLEFRTIVEPVRKHARDLRFYEARCDKIDFHKKVLTCTSVLSPAVQNLILDKTVSAVGENVFELTYDHLVIACGAISNTFNVPGVYEHAFFLKQIDDARRIRHRIIECFELAQQPGVLPETQARLLHFAVVGGGPTGVEFSAELHDLITEDLSRLFPQLMDKVQLTLFDVAPKILTSFDGSLSDYASKRFARHGIRIRTGTHITKVTAKALHIKESEEPIPVGLVVWATGLAPNQLTSSLLETANAVTACPKGSKRIMTDDHLQVLSGDGQSPYPNTYALGDMAFIKNMDLPCTAQVASQKAAWLARSLNTQAKGTSIKQQSPFTYNNRGMMAYVGGWKAIVNVKLPVNEKQQVNESGLGAWLFWRSSYFTMSVSWRNKVLIPVYWFLTWIFGRDTSRL